MKKFLIFIPLLSIGSVQAVWPIAHWNWKQHGPLAVAGAAASGVTGAAVKAYDWWKARKASCEDLITEAQGLLREYERDYAGSAAQIKEIMRSRATQEKKIQYLMECQRSELQTFIDRVLKFDIQLQGGVLDKEEGDYERFLKVKDQIGELAEMLVGVNHYIEDMKPAIQMYKKIRAEVDQYRKRSYKEVHTLESDLRVIEGHVGQVQEYPELVQALFEIRQTLKKRFEELLVNEVEKLLFENYSGELKLSLVHMPVINQCIRDKQLKNRWNYPYVQYAQKLREDIKVLQERVRAHGFLLRFASSVDRLIQIKDQLTIDSIFIQNYESDMRNRKQAEFEEAQIAAIRERTRLEEKARQEALDIERRKARALEAQAQAALDQVSAELERRAAEREKARALEKEAKAAKELAKAERERAEAERKKAAELAEQNRLERQRQSTVNVQYAQSQVGPIPGATAPPMD